MSGYLGQSPGIGQTQYFAFNATAGQTRFSGQDSNGYVLNYNVGFVDVYLNGRRLTPGSDFTATDGSAITLLAACSASDIVFITALSAFNTAQWVTNSINYVYIATANQTTFTGLDSNNQTLNYVAGTIVVSINGIIIPQSDYIAINGSSVIFDTGVNAGDIVQIFALRTMNAVNISSWITDNLTNLATYTYIASQGQTTFSGNAFSGGTLAYRPGCIQVTVNGLLLTPADYTATNGTSVVLDLGCNFDDTVVIWVYSNTTVAGVYTQAQSDAKYLIKDGPAFSAYQNVAQPALTGSQWTKIVFQVEEFDTANCFDNITNYRFTPNIAGYYSISGGARINGTTSGWAVAIGKNGSIIKLGSYVPVSSALPVSTVSSIIYLNGTTDYVELFGFTGTTLATTGTSIENHFSGAFMRSA